MHRRERVTPLAMLFGTFVGFAAMACGDSSATSDAGGMDAEQFQRDGAAGRVELGTGQANFVPIPATGGAMELVAGPQGGWHLNVTAKLYDVTVEGLLLSYAIERDGARISMPTEVALTERRVIREGDHWLRAGDFVVFDITGPEDVIGQTVVVSVAAAPPDGPPVSDSRVVRVVDEL